MMCMQAGIRPGQRLLTVSDPINMGEDLEVSHVYAVPLQCMHTVLVPLLPLAI